MSERSNLSVNDAVLLLAVACAARAASRAVWSTPLNMPPVPAGRVKFCVEPSANVTVRYVAAYGKGRNRVPDVSNYGINLRQRVRVALDGVL